MEVEKIIQDLERKHPGEPEFLHDFLEDNQQYSIL